MIPYSDLKAANAQHREQLIAAFVRVLDSGWYIRGAEVTAFEAALAGYCGVKHCVGVGNGLDALTLILRAWKEQKRLADGDEVIVPANTYIATILAITEIVSCQCLSSPTTGPSISTRRSSSVRSHRGPV